MHWYAFIDMDTLGFLSPFFLNWALNRDPHPLTVVYFFNFHTPWIILYFYGFVTHFMLMQWVTPENSAVS